MGTFGKIFDMKKSSLKSLLKKPSFTGKEAIKYGITPQLLSYYIKKNIIRRIARGVYQSLHAKNLAPFEWQDLLDIAQSIPNGVICLISALIYYDLTQDVQRQFWIAIPHSSKAPKRPKTKIVRMRNITTGRKALILGSYHTFIFDRERCVIDAFRYLSKETALDALRAYLKPTTKHKPDISKLARYGKLLRVNITPYIEALS
jgi:predicted transcriptional regulator of viral defense system